METTFEADDAAPPPRPFCSLLSEPHQYARTAGRLAATPWPSQGPCMGRCDARVHRPTAPGRSSLPVLHESLRSWIPPLEISPSDGLVDDTAETSDTDMAPRARRSFERSIV